MFGFGVIPITGLGDKVLTTGPPVLGFGVIPVTGLGECVVGMSSQCPQ